MTKPLKIKHFTDADKLRAFGAEPIVEAIKSEWDLVKLLNWYNHWYDSSQDIKKGLGWVIDYMREGSWTSEQIKLIEKTEPEEISWTLMRMCRISNNGALLLPKNYHFIDSKLTEICNTEFSKVEPGPVLSLQQKIAERTQTIIGDIEEQIDLGGEFKLFEFLKAREIPLAYIPKILEFYQPIYMEFLALKAGKDKSLKEGYKRFGKVKIARYLALYSGIVQDCKSFSLTKKVTRKPRKIKAKSVEFTVSKLNYAKESAEFKIASINPAGILKAKSLWVFNTKLRKLGVYHAVEGKTLGVKGSTLQDFDPVRSVCKTIRKPEFVLPKILGGGKVYLRKALDDVKAKAAPMTGRINKDVILLRKEE